jgi:peptidyl-tRNA hydrolase
LKQVIVVDDALRLPPGKLAAQVAHASVGAFLERFPSRWNHLLDSSERQNSGLKQKSFKSIRL